MDRHFNKLQDRFHIPEEDIDEPSSIAVNIMSPYSVSMTKRSWRSSNYINIDKYVPKKYSLVCDIKPCIYKFESDILIKIKDNVKQTIDHEFANIWYVLYNQLPLFFGDNTRSYLLTKFFDDDRYLSIEFEDNTENKFIAHYKQLSHAEMAHVGNESDYRPLLGSFWEKYSKEKEYTILRSMMFVYDINKIHKTYSQEYILNETKDNDLKVVYNDMDILNLDIDSIPFTNIEDVKNIVRINVSEEDSLLLKFKLEDKICIYWRNTRGVSGFSGKVDVNVNLFYDVYAEDLKLTEYW